MVNSGRVAALRITAFEGRTSSLNSKLLFRYNISELTHMLPYSQSALTDFLAVSLASLP